MTMVAEHGYFVDKTHYIEKLETIKNPIFLRPRRFGKSLLCQMLKCYYDVNQKDDFDRLFGQTYIGQHPTPSHNSFFVLHLNFSIVKPIGSLSEIEKRFDLACNLRMKAIVTQNFNDKLSLDLGMLTKQDDFYLKLPNLNMQQIFVEYFNDIHQINVSTQYAEIMQHFVNVPKLEQLFAGYWEHYVSQLPETIFQQVNENFYRTTFFELCSRYLFRWFTWHVERSYPQGKSDLEFVGKYPEKFAGLRWVIEFKYYSNTESKSSIKNWKLEKSDTRQIAGYVEGLKKEYPEAHISQFVIYCFGNKGFRVFEV
jgi:hypothetical protein